MHPIRLSVMLAVAAQGVHTPTAETEGISAAGPKGFVVGYENGDETMNLVELVHPPETVDTWSQLMSVTTLMHMSERITLNGLYVTWRDAYRNSCPGPEETVVNGTVDGRPARKAMFYCPRDPKTGRPESLAVIFVQGEVNMFTVQLAFRRSMTSQDKEMVETMQKSLQLCDARDRAACSARRVSGFLPNG